MGLRLMPAMPQVRSWNILVTITTTDEYYDNEYYG